MRIDAEHLKGQLEDIMRKNGWSPEKLAKKTPVRVGTIYNILRLRHSRANLTTASGIAKSLNYKFKVEGDKFYFEQENGPNDIEKEGLTKQEKEYIRIFRELHPEMQRDFIEIFEKIRSLLLKTLIR